jgi:pilus assembly protein Flp/PilA
MTMFRSALARKFRGFMRDQSGATAMEYTIMASCIALAIITTVQLLGTNVKAMYDLIAAAFP